MTCDPPGPTFIYEKPRERRALPHLRARAQPLSAGAVCAREPQAHIPRGRPASTSLRPPRPRRAQAGRAASRQERQAHSLPGGSLQPGQAELLTLNESLVLLSGCRQMMAVTTQQRKAEPTSTKTAHSSPFTRAPLPSTATMQKVMTSRAKRERETHFSHFPSSHTQTSSALPRTRGERGSTSAGTHPS